MSVTAILFVLLLFISMYTQIKQHTLWLMMFVGRFFGWLVGHMNIFIIIMITVTITIIIIFDPW